nr:MAG TPA: hypothetical protein [Caudoviricetes sp.]
MSIKSFNVFIIILFIMKNLCAITIAIRIAIGYSTVPSVNKINYSRPSSVYWLPKSYS